MKYDDASWHYGGDFPNNLPSEAGATHIGMFVSWCLLNGLAGALHTEEFPEMLEDLKNRKISPGRYLINTCDEKFTDEDLTEEGNTFSRAYFASKPGEYCQGPGLDFGKSSYVHGPNVARHSNVESEIARHPQVEWNEPLEPTRNFVHSAERRDAPSPPVAHF